MIWDGNLKNKISDFNCSGLWGKLLQFLIPIFYINKKISLNVYEEVEISL